MLDVTHGGQALSRGAARNAEATSPELSAAPGGEMKPGKGPGKGRKGPGKPKKKVAGTPFDYLLPDLKNQPDSRIPGDPAKVAEDLKALGVVMIDDGPPAANAPGVKVNSTIPAIYTYWGQFIDHDMTAGTDRESPDFDITRTPLNPVAPDVVTAKLRNLRRPTFDLDSLYGNGPGLSPDEEQPDPTVGPDQGLYDGIRMRIGLCTDAPGIPGVKVPPAADLSRDLPRVGPLLQEGVITEADLPASIATDVNRDTRAFIADLRNDENLIVSQFHLAFLRFHNAVVDRVEDDPAAFGLEPTATDAQRFAAVRRLVRFHYQWLVVNDYLETVTLPGSVHKALFNSDPLYKPLANGELFAPLEYSVAAFRFGHSMVRGGYDHNRNFGRPVPPNAPVKPFASFEDLFQFTGNGFQLNPADITKSTRNPFRGAPTLPFNWIIEWDRMSRKFDPAEAHFARKIDTRLAPPILNMVNEGTAADIQGEPSKALRQLLRDLAGRNLLRGYLLSIPTGQAVADAVGVPRLTEEEIRQGNTAALDAALEQGGFLANTPLWYYLLKEAEVRADGNSLGELGSRIVAETQIGLLRNDPRSFLNAPGGWDPSKGVTLDDGSPIVTIRDLLALAGLPA